MKGLGLIVGCTVSGLVVSPFLAFPLRAAGLPFQGNWENWFFCALRGGIGWHGLYVMAGICSVAGLAAGIGLTVFLRRAEKRCAFAKFLLYLPVATAVCLPVGGGMCVASMVSPGIRLLDDMAWKRLCIQDWIWASGYIAFVVTIFVGVLNDIERARIIDSLYDRLSSRFCLLTALCIGIVLVGSHRGWCGAMAIVMVSLGCYTAARETCWQKGRECTISRIDSWLRRVVASEAAKDWRDACEKARNPNTPVAGLIGLHKLCKDHREFGFILFPILRALAQNPSTPVDVLRELAGHEESVIRCTVAGNSGAPSGLLQQLAVDTDAWVRMRADAHLHARGIDRKSIDS